MIEITARKLAIASTLLFSSAALPAFAATVPTAPDTCSIAADAPSTSITVRVTDPTGASLERSALELRCGSTVLNGITGKDGVLTFNVHPGIYTLTAQSPGFADTTQSIQAPLIVPLNIQMQLGSATDTINVSADSGFVPYASNAGSKTNALLMKSRNPSPSSASRRWKPATSSP